MRPYMVSFNSTDSPHDHRQRIIPDRMPALRGDGTGIRRVRQCGSGGGLFHFMEIGRYAARPHITDGRRVRSGIDARSAQGAPQQFRPRRVSDRTSADHPAGSTVRIHLACAHGAGKSICYQLPSLMPARPTLVISPLIALCRISSMIAAGRLSEGDADQQTWTPRGRTQDRRHRIGTYRLIYAAPSGCDRQSS